MRQFPAFLIFCSGVAASAATNLATGLDSQSNVTRKTLALVLWLAAALMFFIAAGKAESALRDSAGVKVKFTQEFRGMRGRLQTVFGVFLAVLATLIMLSPLTKRPEKPVQTTAPPTKELTDAPKK